MSASEIDPLSVTLTHGDEEIQKAIEEALDDDLAKLVPGGCWLTLSQIQIIRELKKLNNNT